MSQSLEARDTGAGVEVFDPGLEARILRLRRSTDTSRPIPRIAVPSLAAVGALAQSLTPVASMVSAAALSGQALTVAFAPAVQTALSQGTLSLMQTASGALPVAVDSMGRIAGLARVMPATAITSAALLPVLLPAAAAAAAAYVQHQALQDALEEIKRRVDAILSRMRDDDWGTLEAADALAWSLVAGDGSFDVPSQLRAELAVARHSVERVFASRRRYVRPLLEAIADDTRGRPDPWTEPVKKLVRSEDHWHEISLYVEAMVVRARMAACTSLVLAQDGDSQAAAVLTQRAAAELKAGYEQLEAVLSPLAGRRPDSRWRDRVPVLGQSNVELFEFAVDLVDGLRKGIGDGIRSLEHDVVVTIPAHDVKMLQAAVAADATAATSS